jgi:methylmalonyl-CoA mutase N-terminal domain/subunit
MALRTQQIIAHETGAADTIDPLAGSYYVEWLTNELEREAQAIIDRVDDLGGSVAAIEGGYMQSEIQEAAVAYQREIESGERVIVGVNDFVDAEGQPQIIFRPNTTVGAEQIARLERVRAGRDQGAVQASLARLREAARGDEPLMPPILEAVRTYASIGEMCGVLREEWGEYTPPTVV